MTENILYVFVPFTVDTESYTGCPKTTKCLEFSRKDQCSSALLNHLPGIVLVTKSIVYS